MNTHREAIQIPLQQAQQLGLIFMNADCELTYMMGVSHHPSRGTPLSATSGFAFY